MYTFRKLMQLLIILGVINLVLIAYSCTHGAVTISFHQILIELFYPGHHQSLWHTVIWHLRLPRLANAWVVGALLALSGCLLQVLLENALADPFIMGISGGSAVGTLLAIACGLDIFWLTPAGWIGALVALLLLLGCQLKRRLLPQDILLTGVMLSLIFGALLSFILSFSANNELAIMMRWLLGDVETTTFPRTPFIVLIISGYLSLRWARQINVLGLGAQKAQTLGVNVLRLRFLLLLLTALMTTSAVAAAGMIGFVGLVVPHLLRYLNIQDYRLLIPGVILTGGGLLILADSVSRLLMAPMQLSIGAITTLLGAPLFLSMLIRGAAR